MMTQSDWKMLAAVENRVRVNRAYMRLGSEKLIPCDRIKDGRYEVTMRDDKRYVVYVVNNKGNMIRVA